MVGYFDLNLCGQGACLDATTQAELDQCFQQALQTPVCSEQYTTCLGDQG